MGRQHGPESQGGLIAYSDGGGKWLRRGYMFGARTLNEDRSQHLQPDPSFTGRKLTKSNQVVPLRYGSAVA